MNTIDERLMRAGRDINAAAAATSSTDGSPARPRRGVAFYLVAAAAVTLLIVGGPVLFLTSGGSDSGPVGAGGQEPGLPEEALPVVQAYWALDGKLDSVGAEEGWLCPVRGPEGYTSMISLSEIPAPLILDLPGNDPVEEFNRSDGPECHQPATMVLIDFTDSSHLEATSAISVWPSTTRFEDRCPDSCIFSGISETPRINGRPSLLHHYPGTDTYDLWWTDSSGAPMHAEAAGVTAEELLALAGFMTVDVDKHTATLAVLPGQDPTPDDEPLPEVLEDLFDRLDDVTIQPSVGIWDDGYWRSTAYFTNTPGVMVTASFDDSFDPYAMLARSVDHLQLVDVNGSVGVLSVDGVSRVTFRSADGAVVSIESEAAEEDTVDPLEIARLLR